MIFPSFTLMSEARIYISTLWFVALGFFLLELLNLKKYQPFFHYLITAINSIVVLFIPLSMVFLYLNWLGAIKFVFVLSYVLFFVSLVGVLAASVLIYKRNRHNASYVVIAFLPHVVWGFSIILVAFRVIETALKLDWIIVISIYEVFVFGYLLTKDFFEAFRMNERLAEDIVRERQTSLVAIETTQIRERRELANYIHDKLGSRLAHISHLVAMNNSALLRENIAELSEEIRVISHRILPKSLDEGALYDSIHAHIINLNNGLRNTQITIENYDFPKIINKDWVYTIYLITLELLTNATKHGKPSLISLEFFGYDEELVIQISDNGSGFNTQEVPKGFGLTSAHSRVKEIGGLLELSSASGEGTIVQITLPRMD
jgi:signal transduction histidine kinase